MVCILAVLALLGPVPAGAEESKVIYLTFDDGPGPYTAQLLDVLQKHDVRATFFLVNTDCRMKELLGRMAGEGHSIGIHSYCHDFQAIYSSDRALMEDIYAMQALIYKHTGIQTWLLRFPGGSSNTVSRRYCYGIMTRAAKQVTQEGFVYFDWNVDSGDAWGCLDTEAIYEQIIRGIRGKDRAVVLQHDVNCRSVAAVERVILWGKANGYTFLPLTADSPTCRHRIQN